MKMEQEISVNSMGVRAVFPGTFDPIHFGHIDIALRSARLFEEVIVAVYDKPLKSLLFSPEERLKMVKHSFQGIPNIRIMGYNGLTVKFCEEIHAQVIVRGLRVFSDFEHEFRMALTNKHLTPEIEVVAFITSEEHMFISSTTVREVASLDGDVSSMVPPHVGDVLKSRFQGKHNDNLRMDYMTSLRD
jgi:pantetheine-phosphate adenylyltransferase